MFGFPGGGDLVRRVKQRLRRNAAAIQTDAAEPFLAFDKDDFFAEISGIKRRGVSARSRADNYDLSFDWVHM
jgi:hypothetical protein